MRRSAAGRAGGRPAAPGPDGPRTRPRALLGAATLTAALVAVPALGPAPAQAAPSGPPDVLAAPATADTASTERPVRITVSRFEPRTITPGSLITVTGTLTNTGSQPITGLALRLQRGEVLTTRAELAALAEDPDGATSVVPRFEPVAEELAPGEEVSFTYTLDSALLQLDRDGAYPALLNVNGTVDGEEQRVGEVSTFVVQQPVQPTRRTAVAWLWPLTERSHRTATGTFADDELAAAVRTDGRLDRALAVVERLPGTSAPGAPETTPALPVTLAVDPALVEELQVMAAGPYEVAGSGTSTGTDDARAFLERLRAVAAVHPVVALPYGDVDVDSLTAAGLGPVVTRSLPGTPEGTAQGPPGEPAAESPAATTSPAEGTGTAAEETETFDDGAGARILADALDVEPRTDLAWEADGTLRADSLALLQDGGIDQVVLGAGGLTTGASAVGTADPTAASASTAGPVEVLVADPALGTVAGSGQSTAGGPRMAEQRYLAELAVLTQQAPEGSEQTVLVAPPRDVDAGPDDVGAMMADTASLTWLRPVDLGALTGGPRTEGGELVTAADAGGLDAVGLAEVAEQVARRDDLAAAVVGDAGTALEAYDAAVARGTSLAWRADPEGFRAAAEDLGDAQDRLRGRVTLLAPADGTYSLASSDAPLVLTVRNDLPFTVQVLLDVRARGNRALSVEDIGAQTLAPGQRAVLQVPTDLRQSGGFAVTARLTTPAGGALGEQVQMQVKSTAYGPISLIITFGAAGLLGLLFLRRLVTFLLRRRRARSGQLPPQDAGAPQPPTRSPV
ncbi:DUF6049 family protein [Blastococcus sp. TF02A-30]|uniref:DUF6049 family protein n=1 Tax=Blastococcus sp. TF02A-30 TaxID=2250580 RepID=UPI000DE9F0BF|nr:DUF6049 family protein [Blastococcus sp. TF02A-30]RBY92657.1 hypothetical protein DQ241_00830 [Blastococcus sp. TF02A-30]